MCSRAPFELCVARSESASSMLERFRRESSTPLTSALSLPFMVTMELNGPFLKDFN